jgi:hypothetical protein
MQEEDIVKVQQKKAELTLSSRAEYEKILIQK